MSAQDNAVLARRIYQLFSEDKFDDVLELVSQDIEAVLVPFGQTFHGREGFMQFMQGFKAHSPTSASASPTRSRRTRAS